MASATITPYTDRFFDSIRGTSHPSAEAIVPRLIDLFQPQSVVDIGCGEGAWLDVFRKLGTEQFLGLDGAYVELDRLLIPKDAFRAVDLAKPFLLDRQFDLAISLEVAEHLPADSAEAFVASLTKCAPFIAFSAAIPGQGGTDHVNEQWPAYWAKLFKTHGFDCYDILRPTLWGDDVISFWYRQNILIFASGDAIDANPELQASAPTAQPASLVHPELFASQRDFWQRKVLWLENPGIRQSALLLRQAFLRRTQ